MVDFTKKEAIRILEKFDYEYLGFLNAGWGEKFYTFKTPDSFGKVQWTLGEMRRKAYLMDMQDWVRMQQASEAMNDD